MRFCSIVFLVNSIFSRMMDPSSFLIFHCEITYEILIVFLSRKSLVYIANSLVMVIADLTTILYFQITRIIAAEADSPYDIVGANNNMTDANIKKRYACVTGH